MALDQRPTDSLVAVAAVAAAVLSVVLLALAAMVVAMAPVVEVAVGPMELRQAQALVVAECLASQSLSHRKWQ